MKRKIIIIISSILLLGVILYIPFYFFYFTKAVIYDLVNIELNGIAPKEISAIKIYGITPAEKKILIYKRSEAKDIPGCFQSIEIVMPDTLISKITTIHTVLKTNAYAFNINELTTVFSNKNTHTYVLPSEVKSEGTFFAKLYSTYPFKVFLSILKMIFISVIAIFILILLIKSLKALKNTDRRKIWFWLKIIGISILIACMLFFGYLLFAYTMSSYITAILFIIFCVYCLWLFIKVVIRIFHISRKTSKRILLSLYIFGILWFSFEFALRFAGVNEGYNEKQGLFYTTGFLIHEQKELKNKHILVHQPYSTFNYCSKEFNYEHKNNNEGLRDIDHSLTKDSNEFRIICIGNSFTEGIGAPQDSTWPKLLENLLIPCSKKKICVFNAGKYGSDPFFEYMLLSERMLKYKPDIVLVALGSSDIRNYRFRGGFERFTPDGLRYRKGPEWEKLYAVSYIVRYFVVNLSHYFDDYNYYYFMSPSEYKAEKNKALQNIHQCVIRFYNLSLKHKFKLAIVFYDDRSNDYKPLIKQLKTEKNIPIIDLFEYNKNIEKITDQNRWKYYWKFDDHNNSRGYLMFARGVKWNLEKMEMIDSIKMMPD